MKIYKISKILSGLAVIVLASGCSEVNKDQLMGNWILQNVVLSSVYLEPQDEKKISVPEASSTLFEFTETEMITTELSGSGQSSSVTYLLTGTYMRLFLNERTVEFNVPLLDESSLFLEVTGVELNKLLKNPGKLEIGVKFDTVTYQFGRIEPGERDALIEKVKTSNQGFQFELSNRG